MAEKAMKEEKMEKGMCEGTCMCKTCGVITGLLVLVAGVVMLLAGLGVAPLAGSALSWEISGAALALVGLSLIVHTLKMCPMCK